MSKDAGHLFERIIFLQVFIYQNFTFLENTFLCYKKVSNKTIKILKAYSISDEFQFYMSKDNFESFKRTKKSHFSYFYC